jgi:CBS domain-containing protein
MRARHLMTQPAIACGADEPLNEAARRMWENDCGALPVIRRDGKVVGMVTDRDICMAAYTRGLPLTAIATTDAMSTRVFSCRPEDPLSVAARVMVEKQVRRLPVIDQDGRLLGILSIGDLALAAAGARSRRAAAELVEAYVEINKPRTQQHRPPELLDRSRAEEHLARGRGGVSGGDEDRRAVEPLAALQAVPPARELGARHDAAGTP